MIFLVLTIEVNSNDEINTELNQISVWLNVNKLSLNVKKSKYIIFHTAMKKVEFPSLEKNNVAMSDREPTRWQHNRINPQLSV